jgi:hypothetical protein
VAALNWVIVGTGTLFVAAAVYWRLVEQEQVRRGVDAFASASSEGGFQSSSVSRIWADSREL